MRTVSTAARIGVQNIVESSQASGTSRKTEIRLIDVARSSLEELRMDYEDFLRQRDLPMWEWEDPRRSELIARRFATAHQVARWVKEVYERDGQEEVSTKSMSSIPSTSSIVSGIAANAALTLITVACSLLDRQIAAQARMFENEGGFSERLYRMRTEHRRKKPEPRKSPDQDDKE